MPYNAIGEGRHTSHSHPAVCTGVFSRLDKYVLGPKSLARELMCLYRLYDTQSNPKQGCGLVIYSSVVPKCYGVGHPPTSDQRFFFKANVTYRHSAIRAYYMVGIHVRKKNTITMKSLENASFSASIGVLFLL